MLMLVQQVCRHHLPPNHCFDHVEALISECLLLDVTHLTLADVVDHELALTFFLSSAFDYRSLAHYDFQQALQHAAVSNNLSAMKRLVAFAPESFKYWFFGLGDPPFVIAVREGHHSIVEWMLKDHRNVCPATALITAATFGHLSMVQFLCDHQLDTQAVQAMKAAITAGHQNVATFLCCYCDQHAQVKCMECMLELAVKGGRFDIVSWIEGVIQSESGPLSCTLTKENHPLSFENVVQWVKNERIMQHTVQIGRMQAFVWLQRRNPRAQLFQWFVFFAGQAGDLELTQWLYERQGQAVDQEQEMLPKIFRMGLHQALRKGHLEAAEFFLDRGIFPRSLRDVVVNGHTDVASRLIKKYSGATWCHVAGLRVAAERGHSEVVTRLDPNGTMDSYSDHDVFRVGDVALLQFHWSRTNGALGARELWRDALTCWITADHVEATKFVYESLKEAGVAFSFPDLMHWLEYAHGYRALSWLLQQEVITAECDFTVVIKRIAEQRQFTLIKQLHEQNARGFTPEAMDRAAGVGSLGIVRFLHQNRREGCTNAAMDAAAAAGYLRVVRFLHERRHEGCTTEAMDQAAANGHLRVVQFLYSHRSEGYTAKAMMSASANGHLHIVRFLEEIRCS